MWSALIYAAAGPVLPPDTQPAQIASGQKVFPYYNPVYPGDAPDPTVLRVGEYFYAAVTGERIMRSRDMVHWENVGTFFGGRYPSWVDRNAFHLWAPDLHYVDGQYLLYFSANSADEPKIDGLHMGIGVAWSDRPEGPYTAADQPFAASPGFRDIDPFLFRDDDGTLYLYWGSASEPILAWQLTADGLATVGDPIPVLEAIPDLRYSRLLEGPWVIKRGDFYYLFWSGDGFPPGQYAVSVARSPSPLGPFERYEENPILQQDSTWASPGHNAVIQDDAGQDWLVYHAYEWSDTGIGRMLLLDQLIWKDGWPHIADRRPSSRPVESGLIWETTAIPIVEVALGKKVLASTETVSRPAQAVIDGSSTTSWLPAPDDEEPWIMVDLGEERRVTKVELRFGRTGDRRYLIETSRDGSEWHVFADRRSDSMYPFSETNEMTARYVRVTSPGPIHSDDGAIRSLRVYAYEGVWISGPPDRGPVFGPLVIETQAAPDFPLQDIRITLNGETLYEGYGMPDHPVVTDVLPDGRHSLALEVTDTNEAIWRHEVSVEVRNAVISGVEHGAVLQGEGPLSLTSGYDVESVMQATVSMIPVRLGEPQENETVVIYTGNTVPVEVHIDTLALADGTYDLRFSLEAKDGNVAKSERRVVVRNWVELHDPFTPPEDLGWFGAVDRKKTIYETPGWDYATEDAAAFFGDEDRRIWAGDGTGDLVWEVPGLDRFLVTLYARDVDLPSLEMSVSADQEEWSPATWQLNTLDASASGWNKIQLTGIGNDLASSRYFRISLGAELGSDVVQLGEVELVYPAPPKGR